MRSDLYTIPESRIWLIRYSSFCSKIDFMLQEQLIDDKKHEELLKLSSSSDLENLTVAETIVDSILLT